MNTPSIKLIDRMRELRLKLEEGVTSKEFLLDLENQLFNVQDFLFWNGCDPNYVRFFEHFIEIAENYLKENNA